jgi:hypothetical protein
VLRAAAGRRLADLIDELPPGPVGPDVQVAYLTFVSLDKALTDRPHHSWKVVVDLDDTVLAALEVGAAHLSGVRR